MEPGQEFGLQHEDANAKRSRRVTVIMVMDFVCVALLLVYAGYFAVTQYLGTPPYVDEERYPVRGIDISSHNGMMNFEAAKADGIEFVFIKASEGDTYGDPNFILNYEKAVAAGLKVGAYHYFRFDAGGVSQAMNLLDRVSGRPLDLGLAVDVEEHGNAKGVDATLIADRLASMLEYLNLKGYRVTLYTNADGYYKYLEGNFQGQPLWVCAFSNPPISADWVFWQYNHRGRVKGINGDVDMNAFNGSRAEWYDHLSRYRQPEESVAGDYMQGDM